MKPFAVALTTLISSVVFSTNADDHAAPSTPSTPVKGFYVGGGLNYNDLEFDSVVDGYDDESASGFQVFAGLPVTNKIDGFDESFSAFAEIGYSRTEYFDFGNGNKEKARLVGLCVTDPKLDEMQPNLYGLVRIGLDMGDDDGLFMGFGAGLAGAAIGCARRIC